MAGGREGKETIKRKGDHVDRSDHPLTELNHQLRIQVGDIGTKLEVQGKKLVDLVEAVRKIDEKLDAIIRSRMFEGEVELPNIPSTSSAIDITTITASCSNNGPIIKVEKEDDREAIERRSELSALAEMGIFIDEPTAINVTRAPSLPENCGPEKKRQNKRKRKRKNW